MGKDTHSGGGATGVKAPAGTERATRAIKAPPSEDLVAQQERLRRGISPAWVVGHSNERVPAAKTNEPIDILARENAPRGGRQSDQTNAEHALALTDPRELDALNKYLSDPDAFVARRAANLTQAARGKEQFTEGQVGARFDERTRALDAIFNRENPPKLPEKVTSYFVGPTLQQLADENLLRANPAPGEKQGALAKINDKLLAARWRTQYVMTSLDYQNDVLPEAIRAAQPGGVGSNEKNPVYVYRVTAPEGAPAAYLGAFDPQKGANAVLYNRGSAFRIDGMDNPTQVEDAETGQKVWIRTVRGTWISRETVNAVLRQANGVQG